MTVWLRRIGARNGSFDLPHQSRDAIRLMVWVDNPLNLFNRKFGHLKLPTEHRAWQPRLLLETAEPGPVVPAVLEPGQRLMQLMADHPLRPYSFRVDLPPGSGNCFRLIEASYPKHKAPICLPPAASDEVCPALAPPDRFNASKPALYTAIGPIRHTESTRDWRGHHSHIAARLMNYVPYHVAMGVSGLLLYADELSRHYLRKQPEVAELMRQGQLRLIDWDMPERGHDDVDGVGRTLGYNYDQALFAGHAMLGLSACGANLMLIVTDIDEYLYFPKQGRLWPEPFGSCMGADSSGEPVTFHQLQRFEILASKVPPGEEPALWITPGTMGRPNTSSSGSSGGSNSSRGELVHPLALYDLVFRQPLSRIHGKPVVLPAAGVVLYFVHEGVPLYGRSQLVHHRCMVLLHVPNFHRSRKVSDHQSRNMAVLQDFQHWFFVKGGANASAAWQ